MGEKNGLVWTKSPPTEPGWYWVRMWGVVEMRRVYRAAGHLRLVMENWSMPENEWRREAEAWAGPIPEPQSGGG